MSPSTSAPCSAATWLALALAVPPVVSVAPPTIAPIVVAVVLVDVPVVLVLIGSSGVRAPAPVVVVVGASA